MKLGITGIETYHSSFIKDDFDYYKYIALKYGLLESVGSDYHYDTDIDSIIIGHGKNNNLCQSDCSVKKTYITKEKIMINKYLKNFYKDAKINIIDIGCSKDTVKEVIKKNEIYYVKESKSRKLDKEYFINNYLKGKLPIPEVVFFSTDKYKSVLITKKLDGNMICCDDIFDDMYQVIELAAKAIKMLQSIDVKDLIINNGLEQKLALAKFNIDNKLVSTSDMNDENQKRFGSIEKAYEYLVNNKIEEEKLCFSHGDLSIPNVFYKDDKITGFLDLGDAGIADMWYDIAILVKSLRRNYETKEAEEYLFKCLNIEPDYKKIEYYILLTELFL